MLKNQGNGDKSKAARCFALVPAAGAGARFGAEIPKQYLSCDGLPLMVYALQTLCANARMDKVFLALSPADEWWEEAIKIPLSPKLNVLRTGGKSRAETVLQSLEAIEKEVDKNDWIAVHDAVRPCLSALQLQTLIDVIAEDEVGGLLAAPLADTLKKSDEKGRVCHTVSRENLWQAQTPQMFRYALLRRALAAHPNVTDEAAAIEAAGFSPRLVPSDMQNFKVTFPQDLALAALILKEGKKS